MVKCLITKLNGVVNNNSILKLGEARLKRVSSNEVNSFEIEFSSPQVVKILGDSYFTNATGTENKGKEISITSGKLYIANAACEVSIENKYDIISMTLIPKFSFDINDLKFSQKLYRISNYSTLLTGDIAILGEINNLTIIDLNNAPLVYGNVASLSKNVNISYLTLDSDNIEGTLDSFENLNKLSILSISKMTGDISKLRNTKLKSLTLSKGDFNGDLSSLPSTLNFTSWPNSKTNFTWSSRAAGATIFSINESPKIDGIDNMLNDFAKGTSAIPSTGETWFKTISATGTRTSASDAAVATLQQKGYTVSITPA